MYLFILDCLCIYYNILFFFGFNGKSLALILSVLGNGCPFYLKARFPTYTNKSVIVI